jgi:hypothetical protein
VTPAGLGFKQCKEGAVYLDRSGQAAGAWGVAADVSVHRQAESFVRT